MNQNLEYKKFKDVNLADPFFDSLKADYLEFVDWFQRKSEESAIVFEQAGKIWGFLYPKLETDAVVDVEPILPPKRRYKVGTFKIDAHGTKLGERFMKKLLDIAIHRQAEELYVTVFPKHTALIQLFTTYGFSKVAEKHSRNGIEDVLSRSLTQHSSNLLCRYPYFDPVGNSKWLLGIKPEFHTQLFPDSILKNETFDVVKDVSHTNSIHKVYVCYLEEAQRVKANDLVVIYRMKDDQGPARFRSVATSICTVEEIKTRNDFQSADDYLEYCIKYSVFDAKELLRWWGQFPRMPFFVIKLCYNAALAKRITRGNLIDEVGLDENARWGVLPLTDVQFDSICSLGNVDGLRCR